MARVQTIIVGGGVGAVAPFTLNAVTFVSAVDPPSISTTDFFSVLPTGVNRGVIVGLSDPVPGPERLRVAGGAILRGSHNNSTSIGDNSATGGVNQTLIGDNITPGTQAGIVIGNSATNGTGGGPNVVIGNGSSLVGAGVVIAGTSSAAGGANVHTVINGTSSGGNNQNHLNIGGTCSITTGVTCLGTGSVVDGTGCTVVGGGVTVRGDNCVTLGGSVSNAAHDNSIVIGAGANAFAAQQCNIGTNVSATPINTIVVGHGLDTTGNPTAVLWRQTNASGTNNAAGAMTLQAGLSTGNIVGPAVNLAVGAPGASSATLQTQRIGVSCSPTTTAADTYLMVYDVDNATLERVTVGAADSGGAGFKLLRIPN